MTESPDSVILADNIQPLMRNEMILEEKISDTSPVKAATSEPPTKGRLEINISPLTLALVGFCVLCFILFMLWNYWDIFKYKILPVYGDVILWGYIVPAILAVSCKIIRSKCRAKESLRTFLNFTVGAGVSFLACYIMDSYDFPLPIVVIPLTILGCYYSFSRKRKVALGLGLAMPAILFNSLFIYAMLTWH